VQIRRTNMENKIYLRKKKNLLISIVIVYSPALRIVWSLRPYAFKKVGHPAVLIQTWKCSSVAISGGGKSAV